MTKRQLGFVVLVLLTFIGPATAVTVVECRDVAGNVSFRDTCPPEMAKTGEKRVSAGAKKGTLSLADIAAKNPVVLYSAPNCDACDLVRQRLQSRGIPFIEKGGENAADVRQELKAISGSVTVPTVTIGSANVSGYDRTALDTTLEQAGFPLPESLADQQSSNSPPSAPAGR